MQPIYVPSTPTSSEFSFSGKNSVHRETSNEISRNSSENEESTIRKSAFQKYSKAEDEVQILRIVTSPKMPQQKDYELGTALQQMHEASQTLLHLAQPAKSKPKARPTSHQNTGKFVWKSANGHTLCSAALPMSSKSVEQTVLSVDAQYRQLASPRSKVGVDSPASFRSWLPEFTDSSEAHSLLSTRKGSPESLKRKSHKSPKTQIFTLNLIRDPSASLKGVFASNLPRGEGKSRSAKKPRFSFTCSPQDIV